MIGITTIIHQQIISMNDQVSCYAQLFIRGIDVTLSRADYISYKLAQIGIHVRSDMHTIHSFDKSSGAILIF